MSESDIAAVSVRGVNLLLWTVLAWRVLEHDRPMSDIARKTVILVAVFGMAALFLGSLVPFGFPGEIARLVYTAFTACAAIAALAMLTSGEPGGTTKRR